MLGQIAARRTSNQAQSIRLKEKRRESDFFVQWKRGDRDLETGDQSDVITEAGIRVCVSRSMDASIVKSDRKITVKKYYQISG